MRLTPLVMMLAGCQVIDAPETIEELVVFGFEHHADGDDWRRAFVEGLLPRVEETWAELGEGYRVDTLNADHLEAAGVADAATESILGALGAASYVHGLDDVVWAVMHPDKDEVFDHYVDFSVTEDGDLDCFLARACEDYPQTIDQTVEVALVGTARSVMHKDHRWVTLGDGMEVLVGRTLVPTPIEFGDPIVEVHQQYDVFVLFPRAGATARVETTWVDASFLDLDLPDYFLVDQAVSGMSNQAERIDALIDSER